MNDNIPASVRDAIVFINTVKAIDIPSDKTEAILQAFDQYLKGREQYERKVRKERQKAGIDVAKEAGVTWGGRKVGTRITLTEEKEAACRKLKDEGHTVASISRLLGIARKTVYQALAREPGAN